MREAAIIVPRHDNLGREIPAVLAQACETLMSIFGGATIVQAQGYWKGAIGTVIEPVNHVTVAYEPSLHADLALQTVARDVAVAADQECVYVRYADGRVELVEQTSRVKAA